MHWSSRSRVQQCTGAAGQECSRELRHSQEWSRELHQGQEWSKELMWQGRCLRLEDSLRREYIQGDESDESLYVSYINPDVYYVFQCGEWDGKVGG